MIWLAQLADGRALVQAGAQIGVGYEVFLPSPAGTGFLNTPEIVASIDCTTRAATREWLITWAGSQTSAPAGAPLVQAQLAPEWFAQPLLRWIHETVGTGRAALDLAGFAGDDVPLDSVITLAGRLASDGLITVVSSGQTATATLTSRGIAAAEQPPPAAARPGAAPRHDHLARRGARPPSTRRTTGCASCATPGRPSTATSSAPQKWPGKPSTWPSTGWSGG
jgi:hypothetical protein